MLRPFGRSMADLDIDFQQPMRPLLVTRILRCCTEPAGLDADFYLDLPISVRIEALLTLATSGGTEPLSVQLNCAQDTCVELLEIELSMEEIVGVQPQGTDAGTLRIPVQDTDYIFRKPTGADQLSWLNESFADEESAVTALVRSLWVPGDDDSKQDGTISGLIDNIRWLEAVDRGMKRMDPLVHFSLTTACPACSTENTTVIDLEGLLLGRLRRVQQRLFHTIHRLAGFYHWSEPQILALSPRRRAYYLSLIDDGDFNCQAGGIR
jgi:hypothetical protein